MSVESFAAFLARLGHRLVSTESGWWYDAGPAFLLAMPSHLPRDPDESELRRLFRSGPVLGVRFPTPPDRPGTPSYQIVCDDPEFGLEKLSANTRSKVRRGLKRCDVRRVEFAEIARHGKQAHVSTLERQARDASRLTRDWDRYWAAAAATDGMEGWAAFVDGEMAAFLVTVDFGGVVEFLLARSRSDLLSAYPNNSLLFAVTQEMMTNRRVGEITFGLQSLEAVDSLDEFKFAMGFRRKAIRQRVELHPLLRTALRLPGARRLIAASAASERTTSTFWRKADGVLRFIADARH